LFSFCYEDVTSDDHDFTNGLAGVIFGGRERKVDECGKIAMWAWAASRIMDYAETLPSLDLTKAVAVAGHVIEGEGYLVVEETVYDN
jgi:hypothetical protein